MTAEGKHNVTESIEREISVPGAVTVVRETAFASETATTDRNTEPAEGAPEVGEELRQERTPGGKVNVVRTKVTPKEAQAVVETSSSDAFSSSTTTTYRNAEEPASAEGVGSASAQPNELGRFDGQVTHETPKPEVALEYASRKTAFAEYRTTTYRNATSPKEASEEGESASASPNRLGRVDGERTEIVPIPHSAGSAGIRCEKTIYEHRHTKTGRNLDAIPNSGEAKEHDTASGKTYRLSAQLNELGKYDTEEVETTEKTVPNYRTSKQESMLETVTESSSANDPSPPEDPSSMKEGHVVRIERQLTPSGRQTWIKRESVAKAASVQLAFKSDENGNVRQILTFQNITLETLQSYAKVYTDGSARKNDYGLYDGSMSLVDTTNRTGSGANIHFDTFHKVFQKGTIVHKEYDKENSQMTIVLALWNCVSGIVNDNADAAYDKCAGAEGDVSVRQLSPGRIVGSGYFAYEAVMSFAGYKRYTETI